MQVGFVSTPVWTSPIWTFDSQKLNSRLVKVYYWYFYSWCTYGLLHLHPAIWSVTFPFSSSACWLDSNVAAAAEEQDKENKIGIRDFKSAEKFAPLNRASAAPSISVVGGWCRVANSTGGHLSKWEIPIHKSTGRNYSPGIRKVCTHRTQYSTGAGAERLNGII